MDEMSSLATETNKNVATHNTYYNKNQSASDTVICISHLTLFHLHSAAATNSAYL